MSAPVWKPINTAPKSTAIGSHVTGSFILGFCPEESADPDGCICVVWWEPLQKCEVGSRRGMLGVWMGEGGFEVRPTHWTKLPALPDDLTALCKAKGGAA